MREIIFDTETTGLDPLKGDRLVEIGCIETLDFIPTGNVLHLYLNPERQVHPDALRIHGLTDAFLKDKPKFKDIVDQFLDFLGDSPLVAHNASFDMGFINAELSRVSYDKINPKRVIDTLVLARKKFPGQQNSLDALCNRFAIDKSHRTKHGALMDAELLAQIYLELNGGRQRAMDMTPIVKSVLKTSSQDLKENDPKEINGNKNSQFKKEKRKIITLSLNENEKFLHTEAKVLLGKKALWNLYLKSS